MFQHGMLQNLTQYFDSLTERSKKEVYFYRISSYNGQIQNFIKRYWDVARKTGVVIEGKIPNPTEQNLAFYEEMMGMEFQMTPIFIEQSLIKWLPRLNSYQRENVTMALYDTLLQMQQQGKNQNILRNAYIKFMCWLYYKFERIVSCLGKEQVPKLLYEGDIGSYELKFMTILSKSGCDIVLLQYHGDDSYLKLDGKSQYSIAYSDTTATTFPTGFSIAQMRLEAERKEKTQRLYGGALQLENCTNAWMSGEILKDIVIHPDKRGTDGRFFYNCFCRMNGVFDKVSYVQDLYTLYAQLIAQHRNVVIVEQKLQLPTIDEISKIQRHNYTDEEQLVSDLVKNILYSASLELQALMRKAFVDSITEVYGKDANIRKLTNKAVYLLCWLKRWQDALFKGYTSGRIASFFYLGNCSSEDEALFLCMLAKLPVDVLIVNPNLQQGQDLSDTVLYEQNFQYTLSLDKFPTQDTQVSMGTTAYYAERELDTMLYQDTGMYRNKQYAKAVSITLQTMYEEIALLWDEEVSFRPHFSVEGEVVHVPVIFAKVSGVKDADVSAYWSSIRRLKTQDTFVIDKTPFIQSSDFNPMKAHATAFFKNGRLQKEKIRMHPAYPYGFLREEIQEHILDKLQDLISQRFIKGTFENGTEYTIIATVLNLNQSILRLIQKFDFTKKNPKILYVNPSEKILSLEDSIVLAFLNLVGFDIVCFIPTGYQNVEKYFAKPMMWDHQIGEYMYDLEIPNLDSMSSNIRQTWRQKLFKRGK